ncbi:MAG: hypothetical protein ABH821_00995 [archaeon]
MGLSLFNKLGVFFVLFLIISLSFAPVTLAQALEVDSGSGSFGGTCKTDELSAGDVQRVWDSLLLKGFTGKEVKSDKARTDTEREALEKSKFIVSDEDQKLGLSQDLPNQKFDPAEVSHLLNTQIAGGFAFGLVLKDTLRTGRCADFSNSGCFLNEQGLKYRNSAVGFTQNLKAVYKDFSNDINVSVLTDTATQAKDYAVDYVEGDETPRVMSEEHSEAIQNLEALDTENQIKVKAVERISTNKIKNNILARNFEASMSTTCIDQGCYIDIYSTFDKMFNAWLSVDFIATGIGPSLIGHARIILGKVAKYPGAKTVASKLKKIDDTIQGWFTRQKGRWISEDRGETVKALAAEYDLDQEWYDMMHNINGAANAAKIRNRYHPGGSLSKLSDKQKKVWAEIVGYSDQVIKEAKFRQTNVMDFGKIKEGKIVPAFNVKTNALAKGITNEEVKSVALKMYKEGEKLKGLTNFGIEIPEEFIKNNLQTKNTFIRYLDSGEMINADSSTGYKVTLNTVFGEDYILKNTPDKKLVTDAAAAVVNKEGKVLTYTLSKAAKDKPLTSGISLGSLKSEIPLSTWNGKVMEINTKEGVQQLLISRESVEKAIKENSEMTFVNVYNAAFDAADPIESEALLKDFIRFGGKRVNDAGTYLKGFVKPAINEKVWGSKRYWSALDWWGKSQPPLYQSMFGSVKGALGWTFLPTVFWQAKRGAGGFLPEYSVYQLPKTWSEIKFTPKENGELYQYSYIDFFSNTGSDEGDMFEQAIHSFFFPIAGLLDSVAQEIDVVKEQYQKFAKSHIVRNEVDNLAVYVTGARECDGCTVSFNSNKEFSQFNPNFFTPDKDLTVYVLEDTKKSNLEKYGQTLISYTHQSDLKGKTEEGDGENIDLEEAIKAKTTCKDKLEELTVLGLNIGFVLPKSASAAGVLALGENLAYYVGPFLFGGLPGVGLGLFASGVQMFEIAPKLKECVDSEEGYYTHFYVPTKLQEEKAEDPVEQLKDAIQTGNDGFQEFLQSQPDNPLTQPIKEIGKNLDKIVEQTEDNDVVEALLFSDARAQGMMEGFQLFYIFVAGDSTLWPSKYRDSGKEIIVDPDTNSEMVIDYGEGTLEVDGQTVIGTDKADFVRMMNTNFKIPAKVIPQKMTFIPLSDSTSDLFEINANGELIVLDSAALNCIQAGIEEQTYNSFSSNNLTSVLGYVKNIATNDYPQVIPAGDEIIASGLTRKIAEGSNSKVKISLNRDTELLPQEFPNLGKMLAIQFEEGIIIFKPSTNELILWVEHPASIDGEKVADFKGELTTATNPLTSCEEPAVNLSIAGNPGSEADQAEALKMNNALQGVGPFQIFETPSKIIMFYAGPAPECKQMMKVIDKESGNVYEQEITSITQEPDGTIKITTADGKTHTMDFSTEGGQPLLDFNGVIEPLLRAQGRNGGFWYDPKTGRWYTENGQMIPLNEDFKQKGMSTQVNEDGSVSSQPGTNVMVYGGQQSSSPFPQLPSLPEQPLLLALFVISLISVLMVSQALIRIRIIKD